MPSTPWKCRIVGRAGPCSSGTTAEFTETCFFLDTLLCVDRLASSPSAREHVTTFVYAEGPDLFLVRSVRDAEDNSALRWTVDTAADLCLIRALYDGMDLGNRTATYQEMLAYVRTHPELVQLNAGNQTWDPPRIRV